MTTTDMTDSLPPTTPPPGRTLRRVRTGRVGAGVAGGLGRYFDVDPVLFRVLFATSAFFGGAGILAYLLAWAAIPEEGTERAPIDGWIGELRRRRIPPWAVAVAGGLFLWAAAFSWWAPGPVLPVVAVVVLLVVAFGRRDLQGSSAGAPETPVGPGDPVSLLKDTTTPPPARPGEPAWITETRTWWDEARRASRERARRALPVKIAAIGGLAAAVAVLAIVDAADRVAMGVYFWTALAFVGGGLLVGAVLRRTPWSIATLLVPITVGLIGLAGSHASFTDGVGERTWTPTSTPAGQYRLAFGNGTLDLRSLPAQDTPRIVRITAGAGLVRILTTSTANVAVEANVHLGDVQVDGSSEDSGVGVRRVVAAPAGGAGARVTVVVHLADGQVRVERG